MALSPAEQADAARRNRANDPRTAAIAARRVQVDAGDATLQRALESVADQARIELVFDQGLLSGDRRVTLHLADVTAGEAFRRILQGTGLEVVILGTGRAALVRRNDAVRQADGRITGRVTDSASGRGLRGAAVKVQGTALGVVTGDDGRFVIGNVSAGERSIVVRLFGYRPVVRDVSVGDGEPAVVQVIMRAVPTTLTDVVTTATGKQRRLEVGNDITVLNVDSLRQVAPITSVTDLLEARVPGLVVMHSSGQPGAPSRVRLRGATSITRSNDPIVVVDGVRMYAEQSTPRNLNTSVRRDGNYQQVTYATPSPLDQIDPNSIETIEVLKGPSAAAIYGSDAGNGVIVITTKRGKTGPTTWSLTAGRGVSVQPGRYPIGYYLFGHRLNSGQELCLWYDRRCTVDRLVQFQALNDPRFDVTSGHGVDRQMSGTLSGGIGGLTYALTGSVQRQTGQLKLPDIEVERFTKFHGGVAPPNWMRHPDRYASEGATSTLSLPLSTAGGRQGTLALTNALFKSDQQQSSLQSAIGQLMTTYVDTSLLGAQPLITEFYERATSGTIHSTNSLQLNWPVVSWLPLSVLGGLDLSSRTNQTLTPRNFVVGKDSIGFFSTSRGTTLISTLTVSTTMPSRWATTAVGFNLTDQSQSDIGGNVRGLPVGVEVPSVLGTVNGAQAGGASQQSLGSTTYGWYLEPRLNWKSRFFVMPGLRLDGGSASGSRVSAGGIPGVSGFPKLNFSWLAVDPSGAGEQRRGGILGALTTLQLRAAVGTAGVQPGPSEELRLLADTSLGYNGESHDVGTITTLGNTRLRPERVRELEGGFHAELWGNRLSADVTQFHKLRNDAIISVPVAASIMDGARISTNIGQVRETGTEVALQASVIERAGVGWTIGAAVSRQGNRVTRLAPGASAIDQTLLALGTQVNEIKSRIVAGYPINGKWARPIVGYADANGDGVIGIDEVLVGDSLAYVGQELPNYELTANTDLTVGRFSFHTTVAYQRGLTQLNAAAAHDVTLPANGLTVPAAIAFFANNPDASLSQQAAFAAYLRPIEGDASTATQYGLVQTVNTLRWQTLSVNYNAPASLARLFRTRSLRLALQGSNLGLFTNYRGKDPNVNAFSTGESVMDSGQLPMPRTFSLKVSVGN